MGTTEDIEGLLRIIHKNHFDHGQIQGRCLKEEEGVYSHRSHNLPPPHTRSIVHWYNMSCKLHSCTSQSEALQLYSLLYCLSRPYQPLPETRRQDAGAGTKCEGLLLQKTSLVLPGLLWLCYCRRTGNRAFLTALWSWALKSAGQEVFREGNKTRNAHL